MATQALDMSGFIDDDIQSTIGVRYSTEGGDYGTDGRWVIGTTTEDSHNVNLQPATSKQIASLDLGGERAIDIRNVHVNDIEIALAKIAKADEWVFSGVSGRFKTITIDNRPWRTYCKIVVSLIDGSDRK